jgi:hypothetical protein
MEFNVAQNVPQSDHPSTSQRLVITIAFAGVALFIAAEPYLVPWATSGMQLFQGIIMVFLWLLLMFGSIGGS